jgi:alpha-ketoglutarate-dependent taurine dioxygenase
MHPQAMIIPDNVEAGKVIRAAQDGPVFRVKADGRLHMRFSARKRNIVWRDDRDTHEAVEVINSYLADDNNCLMVKLEAGQGIICNNVLHNRSAFTDSDTQKRLLYRARYFDAVSSEE